MTLAQLEIFNILKEPITFNEVSQPLPAEYPFKKDPHVVTDNGKEPKVCKLSHNRRQIKIDTPSQYVEQFRYMVSRKSVSEISLAELAAYTGPVNCITHHEVYKPGSLLTPVCLVSLQFFIQEWNHLSQ